MPKSLQIPEAGLKGLKTLIDLGSEGIGELCRKLPELKLTLDVSSLARELAAEVEIVGLEETDWERIIRNVLIPLNQVRAEARWEPEQVVSAISESLADQDDESFDGDYRHKWEDLRDRFRELFAPDTYFSLLSKAIELFVSRPAILLDLKMLTEIRPVYNDDATEKTADILTNTLVLRYQEGGEARTLHVAMDLDDLCALSRELERVRQKNDVAFGEGAALNREVLYVGERGE
jgi:hypothetical protein